MDTEDDGTWIDKIAAACADAARIVRSEDRVRLQLLFAKLVCTRDDALRFVRVARRVCAELEYAARSAADNCLFDEDWARLWH